jgi:hypothetical protein
MGFTQNGSFRCFHFQHEVIVVNPNGAFGRLVQFTVTADMLRFAQHGVAIQEAPAICRRILTEALIGKDTRELGSASYHVTDEDLVSFASAQATAGAARAARQQPRPHIKPDRSAQPPWSYWK